jgi:hypothetical protein
MKSNSDTYPLLVEKSNGKTQVRFNIVAVEKEDLNGGTRSSYDYDFVEITGELSRGKVINAIIGSVHTPDEEMALINNEIAAPGTAEYDEYQKLRDYAKSVADEVEAGDLTAVTWAAAKPAFVVPAIKVRLP